MKLIDIKNQIVAYLVYHKHKLFPRWYANKVYRTYYGRDINWENPTDIDEKISWLKFYSDTSKWSLFADKYRVRKYVKDCGCADLLIPLYAKWDSSEEISLDDLPDQFVMKVNNGSGDVLIVKDKNNVDLEEVRAKFRSLLHRKYGVEQSELHYKHIKPCIICEQYLESKQIDFSFSAVDYKIWCFDGEPKYIWVVYNRTSQLAEMRLYDLDWNDVSFNQTERGHFVIGKHAVAKPQSLPRMIEACKAMSKGIPQVRLDFYDIDGKAYFGEMTMTSSGAINLFYKESFRKELGAYVKLPKKRFFQNH